MATSVLANINVRKVSKDAIIPRREAGAVGYDLFSTEKITILPGKSAVVETGIVMDIPYNCYGRIASLYSLSSKYSITVDAGVINPGNDVKIKVILVNYGTGVFSVEKGNRVAQLIFENISIFKLTHDEN